MLMGKRFVILLATWLTLVPGQVTAPMPLRQTELLALVAGNALPENVVQQILTNGLAFRPDPAYRAFLMNAGANPMVLKALDSAKVSLAQGEESAGDKANTDVLQRLSDAARLMHAKRYDEAARNLTAAVTVSFKSPECGFVMGELLQQREDWERAEVMYEAVLNQEPDFPEVHTKLSYILYRLGDADAALREAKVALAITPDNAEAHKNAGLALSEMRKFDAAAEEYKQALRLKPDYKPVRYGLAHLGREQSD